MIYKNRYFNYSILKIGSTCNVVNFANTNDKTVITCQTPKSNQINANDFVGNRGINVFTSNFYTPVSNFSSAIPPVIATSVWLDKASYSNSSNGPTTIWMIGYFAPAITSVYSFSLTTNVDAQLFLSNNSNSANKVKNSNFKSSLNNFFI